MFSDGRYRSEGAELVVIYWLFTQDLKVCKRGIACMK